MLLAKISRGYTDSLVRVLYSACKVFLIPALKISEIMRMHIVVSLKNSPVFDWCLSTDGMLTVSLVLFKAPPCWQRSVGNVENPWPCFWPAVRRSPCCRYGMQSLRTQSRVVVKISCQEVIISWVTGNCLPVISSWHSLHCRCLSELGTSVLEPNLEKGKTERYIGLLQIVLSFF